MACEVAAAAEAGGLVLFHHDPAYDDGMIERIEREARGRFEKTVAAYEGLVITLTPTPLPLGEGSGARAQRRVKYAHDGRN
jgi:hypothetical protein